MSSRADLCHPGKAYDILKAAVDNTNATVPPEELQTMVTTQVVTNTSLLRMSVTYDDPVMAAVLANEIARQPFSTARATSLRNNKTDRPGQRGHRPSERPD